MTTIEFYQPNKVDCRIEFPTEWDDFSYKDLISVESALSGFISIPELTIKLIEHRRSTLPSNWQFLINHEQAAIDLLPIVYRALKNNNLTKNPFKIHHKMMRRFIGPDDSFNDLTVGEYEDCECFSIKYQDTGDIIWLEKLFKTLWRPCKAGKRVPHHEYSIKELSYSKRTPTTILRIAYRWYCGCNNKLPLLFPRVFKQEEGEAKRDVMAVTTIIHYGAGAKNGTRDQIRRLMLKEFLYECELAAQQQEELEKHLNELKKKRR